MTGRNLVWCGVAAILLVTVPAQAKKDWRKLLREPAVQKKGGKYIMSEYGLMSFPKLKGAKQIQVHVYTEAPASGVISRDNVVAISTMMQTVLLMSMAEEASRKARQKIGVGDLYKWEEIDAPIGKVDLEIRMIMTKEGMQFSVGRKSFTRTWAQIYED